MRDMVYYYDGSFDGFLCCVYDSFRFEERPVQFLNENSAALTLFPARLVETDLHHSRRVLAALKETDPYAKELVFKGFLTSVPDREHMLYRFVSALHETGSSLLDRRGGAAVRTLIRAVGRLDSEVRLLRDAVRFSEFEGMLVGDIRPKNRVLPLLWPHFCGKMNGETFLLYDHTHQEALAHQPGKWAILPLEEFRFASPAAGDERRRRLWNHFCSGPA